MCIMTHVSGGKIEKNEGTERKFKKTIFVVI
jgi:hypothetical protein